MIMEGSIKNVLLTGSPGCGKATVTRGSTSGHQDQSKNRI